MYSNDTDSEAETDALVLCDSLNDADSLAETDALSDAETEFDSIVTLMLIHSLR